MAVKLMNCIVCGRELQSGYAAWHLRCLTCGYERGLLESGINNPENQRRIDEEKRSIGLAPVREETLKNVLDSILKLQIPENSQLLEVGSAHGWFLELAKEHYRVLGIEPDKAVLKRVRDKTIPLRSGYFPAALEDEERFSVIIFNDVIEHIADIESAVKACFKHLETGGYLVLTLPTSDGIYYRIARILASVNIASYFERMWQYNFPSPHIHYFNNSNLILFVERHGFKSVNSRSLNTIKLKGLLERIRHVDNVSLLRAFPTYVGLLITFPIFRYASSDIMVQVFRKSESLFDD